MDAARELFHQFKSRKLRLIYAARNEKWEESPVLDFKNASKQKGPMETDDRKYLAEALSGFANSDGGVLVWGVDCRRVLDEADVVQELRPIANLKRFLSDLNTYTPQAVSPAVIGVEHQMIADPDAGTDAGYVVTYVPRAETGLHMAIAKGDQFCYFFRSGTAFQRMPAWMVADRYRQRPQPKLELSCVSSYEGVQIVERKKAKFLALDHSVDVEIQGHEFTFMLGIRNVGLGVALYPATELTLPETLYFKSGGIAHGTSFGLPQRMRDVRDPRNERSHLFAGGVNDVVYPGTTLDVARAVYRVVPPTGTHPTPPLDQTIRYALYCDGFVASGELTLTATDLNSLVTRTR
jgi:hypothetical protein